MTAQVGERVAHTPDTAVRALRDEKRLPGTQNLARSVDADGSRARDANYQHIDFVIDVLCHALPRGENQQIHVQILAFMRLSRSRRGRGAGQRGKFDRGPRTRVLRGGFR